LEDVWCTSEGRVYSRDGRIIVEGWHRRDSFIHQHLRNYLWGISPANHTIKRQDIVTYDHLIVVAQSTDAIYGHFLCEVIPRLGMLPLDCLNSHQVYASTRYPQYLDLLCLAGVNSDNLISSMGHHMVYCKKATIPSFRMDGCHQYPRFCMDALRKVRQAALLELNPYQGSSKIFVSRGAQNLRANEGKLIDLMVSMGFKVIDPAQHSLAEQAAIFHAAEVVVGPHGSGLFNVVFSRAGTRVVSLLPGANNSTLYCIARAFDLDYRVVKAPAGNLASWSQNQQYEVQLDDVCQAIEA
jgi:capsular polysaccharide biosynthesis protein